ncbi:MAG: MATE family efflux transporter [Endomicrobium sp.]|uniref:MATE family efflux transporter n=1 Tax=Candidatus Endomicrobiellum cubanum TaxID=3242325 RepID=UPI002829B92C|nr:MATE family efflux transporter [Endomicrobium sp.]MDR2395112.1 MATE family efflux transporter [Endomicrobium sp.]
MIISTSAWAFQSFIDRFFLIWYSKDAYAASLPSGLLNCSIINIFAGMVAYVDVFVAQYNGKKEYRSIGNTVWQSFYIAVFSSFALIIFTFFSQDIFNFIGHPKSIICEEVKYFNVLCYGSFTYFALTALSGFYSGRGKTTVVLLVNVVGVLVNIVFDYLLIFGKYGFPEQGITGAAIGTFIGFFVAFILLLIPMISQKNNKLYLDTLKRLIRFGLPNGIHMSFDISVFTLFSLAIGTLGKNELVASNMAMNIYNIAYMPLLGFGMTTSIIVGNYLGKNKASTAQIAIKSVIHIPLTYVLILVMLFLMFPDIFIYPFSRGKDAFIIEQIRPIVVILFRFIASSALFEAVGIVFSSAIKGAGDTKFVMQLIIKLALFVSALMYLIVGILKMGLYPCWSVLTIYCILIMFFCYKRYKTGKWKHMRVVKMKIVDG